MVIVTFSADHLQACLVALFLWKRAAIEVCGI